MFNNIINDKAIKGKDFDCDLEELYEIAVLINP